MSEEIIQESYKYVASVRFQNTRKPYTFGTNDETLEYGDFVVVETARGKEMGEMISSLRDASTFSGQTALKPIHRKATYEDRQAYKENKELAKEAMKMCAECIRHQQLDMNLISCEYTLDRSKVIFIYVSENRVDFRELLKELTQIFKCRIELRQIGPRDKAKMIGGLGACGLETCCSRFLDNFDVVSINMAKNQLLALNIPKLSGQCGKLMCCLKYEDELYKEMRQGLPKMNAQMEYEGKLYRLTSMNLITRQCKLENKETSIFITIDEMMEKAVLKKPMPTPSKKEEGKEKKIEKAAPQEAEKEDAVKSESAAKKEMRKKAPEALKAEEKAEQLEKDERSEREKAEGISEGKRQKSAQTSRRKNQGSKKTAEESKTAVQDNSGRVRHGGKPKSEAVLKSEEKAENNEGKEKRERTNRPHRQNHRNRPKNNEAEGKEAASKEGLSEKRTTRRVGRRQNPSAHSKENPADKGNEGSGQS